MLSKETIIISDPTMVKNVIDVTDIKYILGFKVTNKTGHLIHWELVKDKNGKVRELIIHE